MAEMIGGIDYAKVKAYNNRYRVFQVDLTGVPLVDESLNLSDVLDTAGITYASYMTILAVPSAFTFKLNSAENSAINAVVNLEVEDFEITEIYITAPGGGVDTALIEVEYRVD